MWFKKMISAGMVLSVLLLPTNTLDAERSVPAEPLPKIVNTAEAPMKSDPNALLILQTHHQGRAAYTGSFTMVADNGTLADIIIENHSNHPMYMNLYVDDYSEPIETTISKNNEKTVNLLALQDTSVKVYIYSRIGHEMDLSIRAEQFR
ncbi:hypothetical protein [Paenibacillus xylanilyticus]|uniref:Uncharacterized protein n=1 Tax=Paenibacillus xylanilyticus TaxID=248903 RepID=A0A7Y6C1F1_9BACL|nr:hypothetical protein [Paenibacillus xylanilyticus]NUU78035.1 hypothetical protein [Paenibacillus xylanilyticus]